MGLQQLLLSCLPSIWLFLAFLLLLLVTLSLPITKTIYIFTLAASNLWKVTFGIWGYCISALQVSVLGIDVGTSAQCSQAKLGLTFDSTVTDALNITSIADVVSGIATAAQILHPIACALTFFAFLNSLSIQGICRPSLQLPIAAVATLFTLLMFIIDVIIPSKVRDTVNKSSDNVVTLSLGNGVWIVLVVTIGSLFVTLWYLLRWFRGKRNGQREPKDPC